MSNLNIMSLKKLAYRGHPKLYSSTRLIYDKEDYLKEYLSHAQIVPASYESGETCKDQMNKSRLVVVDNPSTSYLESLHMNIPTVFFWNSETNYLDERYTDFYKPLIDVGICQTDPVKAAEFVNSIIDNPEEWWQRREVQEKKNEWLNSNFQKPQVMIDYLLELTKE